MNMKPGRQMDKRRSRRCSEVGSSASASATACFRYYRNVS